MNLNQLRSLCYDMGDVSPYVDETFIEKQVKLYLKDVFNLISYLIRDKVLSPSTIKRVNKRFNELLADIINISGSSEGYEDFLYDALKWIEESLKGFIKKSIEFEHYEAAANLKKVLDEHFIKINE